MWRRINHIHEQFDFFIYRIADPNNFAENTLNVMEWTDYHAVTPEALVVKTAISDILSRNFKILSIYSDLKILMDCINSQNRCMEVQSVLKHISTLRILQLYLFLFYFCFFNAEADSLTKMSLQELVSHTSAN